MSADRSSEPGRPDEVILDCLRRENIIDAVDACTFEALTGGVSSDIWRVRTARQDVCVKRALRKLKVAADWRAPIERNAFEVAYYQTAGAIVPARVPTVLYHDAGAGLFVMPYYPLAEYRVWKQALFDDRAEPEVALAVANTLVRVHAATAFDDVVAARFPRTDIFHAIRLEPYLEATALKHPDLHDALFALSRRTASRQMALVHGDVSPKNILVGADGPVLLDAECACIGDPAFDLAFCLNHLLLKSIRRPAARARYNASFVAMVNGYLGGVDWESASELEARAASLLPALMLARVDGKSPVEYISEAGQRARVRRCARPLVVKPPDTLDAVIQAWNRELDT